ncbi:MAG TPA: hypothetical protein VJ777_30175 [Mycobacterium sp.]|nr:hypothetical protein [Mycobacterium sp.]
MTTTPDIESWGEWALGDLVDVARDVAGLLGPSQEVRTLVIETPAEDDMPHVRITVDDESGTLGLRNALKSCGYETEFIGYPSTREWSVVVAETVLTIETDRGSS